MQRTLFGYDSELNLNAKAYTTDNIISLADERLKAHKTEYDRAGRVLKLREQQYQYDECGRLIEKTETKKGFRPQKTRYQWNADDQLVQVDLPNGERWRYQYDPFSRRISKTCLSAGKEQAQRYQWDGDRLIQNQHVVNGEVQQHTEWAYEPGSFRPVAQITQQNDQSRLHYIVTDITGSARELVNEQGHIVWRGYQEVWGNAHQQPINLAPKYAANDSSHDPIECDLRYPGQIFDKETGLYYNRYRYYDAYTGQYLSSDPIGMAGGLRPQAYVHNPVDWADPLGLAKCPVDKIMNNARSGKVRKGKDYHGRLDDDLERDILSNPDGVYRAKNDNLIFHKDGNVVVTHGKGGAQGNVITSYGHSGPRGESGASIYGGSPSDPGLPITKEMILNGEIPRPNGGFIPPATEIPLT